MSRTFKPAVWPKHFSPRKGPVFTSKPKQVKR